MSSEQQQEVSAAPSMPDVGTTQNVDNSRTSGVFLDEKQSLPTDFDAKPLQRAELRQSLVNPELKPIRRIIAEDIEWSLRIVPTLTDLSLNSIVKNFDTHPKHDELLTEHRQQLLKSLSTQVPLKVTAPLIQDEQYWKRCCLEKWPVCDVKLYDNSWKRLYFEKTVEDIIEHFVPSTGDPKRLYEYIELGAEYIIRLDIKQLLPPVEMHDKIAQLDEEQGDDDDNDGPDGTDVEVRKPLCDHFDFTDLIKRLPNLQELHLVYGVKDCGMNFDWNMFEFTKKDCQLLSKSVLHCKTLRVLHIHRSKIDDYRIRMLIRDGLLDHPTLEELNLEHNQISDRGCRAIAKLLNGHSKLLRLNLCNNNIGPQGAQAIAYGLTKSITIEYLNLRLNRIGDEGGQSICLALLMNQTLKELNLSCNNLTEPTGNKLAEILNRNKTLLTLDLSANRLGQDIGKSLQECLQENSTILNLDLRMTECGQESEYIINQILKQNKENDRLQRIGEKNQQDTNGRTYNAKGYLSPNSAFIQDKVAEKSTELTIVKRATNDDGDNNDNDDKVEQDDMENDEDEEDIDDGETDKCNQDNT
ncbi:unnamed protein product, partial [Didymodactylos carnosus]